VKHFYKERYNYWLRELKEHQLTWPAHLRKNWTEEQLRQKATLLATLDELEHENYVKYHKK
jgi:protein-tyrosine-phosphatase